MKKIPSFIFHCYFLVEYLSTVNPRFTVGWADPGAGCTGSFFPRKIPKKLLLSCFTWRCFEQVGLGALQRSPPTWAGILYQEHKFWINSDWQMLFLLTQVLRWCHFKWALDGLKEPGNCDMKSETPELLHLKMFCLTAQLVSAHCVQHLWKRCLWDWKGNKLLDWRSTAWTAQFFPQLNSDPKH